MNIKDENIKEIIFNNNTKNVVFNSNNSSNYKNNEDESDDSDEENLIESYNEDLEEDENNLIKNDLNNSIGNNHNNLKNSNLNGNNSIKNNSNESDPNNLIEIDPNNSNESDQNNSNENDPNNSNESDSNENTENIHKNNELQYIVDKKEDEIKNIIFNNNSNKKESMNFSNNEIENITFNNIGENNITNFIFGNQNVIVDEEVAIKSSNILYKDDIVYLKELENQLLSEYEISKQSLKFIQKEVEETAKKIIELKNSGVKKYTMMNNGIEYNLINDIINDKFNKNFIIPIVLDKHKIYTKLKEDNENVNNNEQHNIYFSESHENVNGIIEENQKTQSMILKNLYHDKALNKLSFQSFLNKVYDISKPYITKYNLNNSQNIGYIKKLIKETEVLRYYDYNNINWNTYIVNNDYLFSTDIYDEVSKKIIGIEENILIKGDEINIIGFMLLSNENIENDDIYTSHNYTNFLSKVLKKKGMITKIFNTGNKVIIKSENHNISEGDIIYIDNTNSFPRINNMYSKSIKIIDNNTIELDINIKITREGNNGIIYILTKLEYDLYRISKENNNIDFILKESTYKNIGNENKKNHNKIYLFDNMPIDKNDYDSIIKKIFPTINEIIINQIDNLNKSYTFNEINNILKKSSLSINELNIEQIEIIKNILEKNLINYENIKNIKNKIKLKFNKNILGYFKNNDYFLSNKFITNANIVKIYGNYIHLNKPEDNLILRIKWIQSQKDNGKLYYLYYLLSEKNSNKNNSLKYIQNKIEELQNLYSSLERNFEKEKGLNKNNKNKASKLYKYQAYIINEEDHDVLKKLKNILPNGTVVFYKDNLYIWNGYVCSSQYPISSVYETNPVKLKDLTSFENIEENTLALVGDSLWIWKKDKWYKSDATPKYDNIKYLCEFNNFELSEIKLDALDCIYRKDSGCNSKMYVRFEENMNTIKENLENFKKLEYYISNNENYNNITTQIDSLKKIFYSSDYNRTIYGNKKINNFTSITKEENIIRDELYINKIVDQLDILLDLIYGIQNYAQRLNYIYMLIDKDMMVIDHKLYSKKFQREINLCSHFYYLNKINYANSPEEKTKLIDTFLAEYSDYGESEANSHTCKYCGVVLYNNEYDDTEGFSDSGMIKRSREIWVPEEMEKNKNSIDLLKFSDIEDKTFKEILLKFGLSQNDVDEAVSVGLYIIKNLFPKSGVTLPNIEIINIIVDSLQKIKYIKPYYIYKMIEVKKLEEKGQTKINIQKIDEKNIFKVGYDRYLKIKKNSIIAARFLISVQTSIPSVNRLSKTSVCVFDSFDGDNGITYISCILDEMQVVLLKDKTKTLQILKDSVNEYYEDFKKMVSIKKLFSQKKTYEFELSKKKDKFQFMMNNQEDFEIVEPVLIEDNFETLITGTNNNEIIKNLHNVLLNRLNFISYKIKNIIKDVIEKSQLTDTYSGLIESSCCTEDALQYIDYYLFIELESSYPIKKLINESLKIINFTKYFISIGSIHKFELVDKNKFDGIYNTIIVDDEIHTSESLIKSVFEFFVDTGIFTGLMREYVGSIDNLVDIKSGLTKKEIMSKNYTIEEYRNLLKNIESHNIKYYKEKPKIGFEKSFLDSMKKKSNNKLDTEINNLVKNIASVLNKDKIFIQKYVDLIRNIGIFSYEDNEENKNSNLSEKSKIKNRESLNRKKLDYIKTFYITKLKKYLSIIKNDKNKIEDNIEISFETDNAISYEIQSIIYNENKKLVPFLNYDIRKYFLDLNLEFSNEEINSINGIDNIYNSKYDKIKIYSDFNFNDASNVLLYMIISQLNKFILCFTNNSKNSEDENYNSEKIYNIDKKDSKCKYICQFILLLFEELDQDSSIFNDVQGIKDFKNIIIHERLDLKDKIYFKEKKDYSTTLMEIAFGKKLVDINIDDEINMVEDEIDYKNQMEFITEKAKKDLTEKYGFIPTEDQIETYKDDYIKDMQDESMFEEEIYDLSNDSKGKEVLDQGADYGGFNEYDFETGDGFDYSDEMIE